MNFKRKEGITLIALVITIIVLLILAAVSIATLTGENGILTRALDSKTETEIADEKEKIELSTTGALAEGLGGEIGIYKLRTELGKYFQDGKYDVQEGVNENGIEGYIVTITENDPNGRKYFVDKNGNITEPGTPPSTTIVSDFTGNEMYAKTENTLTQDEYGNPITIPAGFKVVIDNTTNNASHVTEGIVIQDEEGNQFVWVPVGKIYTTVDEATKESTAVTINLSRYEFADGTSSYTANDGSSLGVLDEGTPIDRGTSAIITSLYSYTHTEDTVEGNNTHAKELEVFKSSTNTAKGYYIARYEASYGIDGKANSKVSTGTPIQTNGIAPTTEGLLWNNITQPDAATASKAMYSSQKFTSDLINSYAWDTAIVFIQTFGGTGYETYSRQHGYSINSNLTNTGENKDNPLNINDMASNTCEWTTETSSYQNSNCTYRGGNCNFSDRYTANRLGTTTSACYYDFTFRPILYVKN